jgi:hypothetical protein
VLAFKDLKKRVSLEIPQQQARLFERLLNKPFWIWDQQQHKLEDIKTNAKDGSSKESFNVWLVLMYLYG